MPAQLDRDRLAPRLLVRPDQCSGCLRVVRAAFRRAVGRVVPHRHRAVLAVGPRHADRGGRRVGGDVDGGVREGQQAMLHGPLGRDSAMRRRAVQTLGEGPRVRHARRERHPLPRLHTPNARQMLLSTSAVF
eukprot:3774921-Rhodomonas_salina.1